MWRLLRVMTVSLLWYDLSSFVVHLNSDASSICRSSWSCDEAFRWNALFSDDFRCLRCRWSYADVWHLSSHAAYWHGAGSDVSLLRVSCQSNTSSISKVVSSYCALPWFFFSALLFQFLFFTRLELYQTHKGQFQDMVIKQLVGTVVLTRWDTKHWFGLGAVLSSGWCGSSWWFVFALSFVVVQCSATVTLVSFSHRYNNRTYRIDDIEWDKNPSSTFLDHSGENISYLEYYR